MKYFFIAGLCLFYAGCKDTGSVFVTTDQAVFSRVPVVPAPHDVFPPRVQDALDQAERFWKAKADVRHVIFVFEEIEVEPYSKSEIGQVEGRWRERSHTLELNIQDWDQDRLVSVVTHEYGHALGHEHSIDPNNIMYPFTHPSLASLIPEKKTNEAYLVPDCSSGGCGGGGSGDYLASSGITWSPSCIASNQVAFEFNGVTPLSITVPKSDLVGIANMSCGDWTKMYDPGTTWEFTIDGKKYVITGDQLSAYIKEVEAGK